MRALHRTIAVGAFGGFVAATAAGTMAFACTPVPDAIQVRNGNGQNIFGVVAAAGETINVHISNPRVYAAGIQVQNAAGKLVTTGPVQISWFKTATATSGELITQDARGAFDLVVKIPADISTVASDPSQIVLRQADSDGNPLAADSEPIWARIAPPAADVNPANVPGPSLSIPVVAPEATPAVQPAPSFAKAPAIPVVQAPVVRSVAPVAPTAAPAAAPARPVAAPAAPPAVPTAGVVSPLLVPETAPQQATADLWSGLSAERLPSLLDSAPAPATKQFPVGGVLFGAGLLTVAGAALALGGRRLAVVRRIVSRR